MRDPAPWLPLTELTQPSLNLLAQVDYFKVLQFSQSLRNLLAYHSRDWPLFSGRRVPQSLPVERPAVPAVFVQLYPVAMTGGADGVEKLLGDQRVRVRDAAGGKVGTEETISSGMRHLG